MRLFKLLFVVAALVYGTTFINAANRLGLPGNETSPSAITIEASQLYASFNFIDTKGTVLNKEYRGIFTGAYSAGYRHVFPFGLMIPVSLGIINNGASMAYDNMNYSWNLRYARAKAGAGYIYRFGKINPYFSASGYYGYLLQATQILNNENFDILKLGDIRKMDYGVLFSPGVEFMFSSAVSSFIEFNYLWGLNNIETDALQKTSNIAYGLTFGLSFSFSK